MQTNIKTAMILAAGMGSRLRPLTDYMPKALVEVQRKPMLEWTIGYLIDAGFKKIIINTSYLNAHIEKYIHMNDYKYQAEFHLIHEPKVLGTGGSILNAMQTFGEEPYFAINCDAFFWDDNPVPLLLEKWQPDNMDALLLLHDKNRMFDSKKGDVGLDDKGNIIRDTPDRQYIMVGCSIFTPQFFSGKDVGFFSTPEIFFNYSPRYFGLPNPYNWIDIGSHKCLKYANDH